MAKSTRRRAKHPLDGVCRGGVAGRENCANRVRQGRRCRPCKAEHDRQERDKYGVSSQPCGCGRRGRVYLDDTCPECWIAEMAFQLWKEQGQPDKPGKCVNQVVAEYRAIRAVYVAGDKATAIAQGKDAAANNMARRLGNAKWLAQQARNDTRQLTLFADTPQTEHHAAPVRQQLASQATKE